MTKRIIIGIVLVALALGVGYYFFPWQKAVSVSDFAACERAGYPVAESYPRQCRMPDGRSFTESVPARQEGPVTIRGEIACLPKKGSGPQTLECLIGLRAEDGMHYSLGNLSTVDPEYHFSRDGLSVEVTGEFIREGSNGPDGNAYDVAGIINVATIREIYASSMP